MCYRTAVVKVGARMMYTGEILVETGPATGHSQIHIVARWKTLLNGDGAPSDAHKLLRIII